MQAPAGSCPDTASPAASATAPDPGDAPRFWRTEASGELAPAVEHFVDGKPLTLRELARIRKYFIQWADAPCWERGPIALHPRDRAELRELREAARRIYSERDARAWIRRAARFGIDPL